LKSEIFLSASFDTRKTQKKIDRKFSFVRPLISQNELLEFPSKTLKPSFAIFLPKNKEENYFEYQEEKFVWIESGFSQFWFVDFLLA